MFASKLIFFYIIPFLAVLFKVAKLLSSKRNIHEASWLQCRKAVLQQAYEHTPIIWPFVYDDRYKSFNRKNITKPCSKTGRVRAICEKKQSNDCPVPYMWSLIFKCCFCMLTPVFQGGLKVYVNAVSSGVDVCEPVVSNRMHYNTRY